MDALILSCGTGGGHNAAGKAIGAELIRRGHHAEMMNPYTLYSGCLAERIDHMYIATAQKAPGHSEPSIRPGNYIGNCRCVRRCAMSIRRWFQKWKSTWRRSILTL